MKNRAIAAIGIGLILSIAVNIYLVFQNNRDTDINENGLNQAGIERVNKLRDDLNKYEDSIQGLNQTLDEKNEQIFQMKQIEEDYSLLSLSMYAADEDIHAMNNAISNLKVMDDAIKRSRLLDHLVMPEYIMKGDDVGGLIVSDVRLDRKEGYKSLLQGYGIQFDGEFEVSGTISFDFMEYGTYFIESAELEKVPFSIRELSGNGIAIAMIGSKDDISARGYKDGDYITVKLKNLTLSSYEYKPMANTADFIEIIE